jgi:hypothetical protein
MALTVLSIDSSTAGFGSPPPPPPPIDATQQVGGGVADPTSPSIIRQYGLNGRPYASDLIQLESDAVAMYLSEHGLPAALDLYSLPTSGGDQEDDPTSAQHC